MPPKSQYWTSVASWSLTHFRLLPRWQGASFTFLSQDPEDDADSTAEEHSHFGAVEEIKTNPWQTTTKLPYDSSDENEDGDDMDIENAVDNDIQSSKSTSHLDELFFFHPDDPKLANRINGEMSLCLSVSVKLFWGNGQGSIIVFGDFVYSDTVLNGPISHHAAIMAK